MVSTNKRRNNQTNLVLLPVPSLRGADPLLRLISLVFSRVKGKTKVKMKGTLIRSVTVFFFFTLFLVILTLLRGLSSLLHFISRELRQDLLLGEQCKGYPPV